MIEEEDVLSQFESERRTGLGATDSPKVLGLDDRGTPLSVYLDKIGEGRPGQPSLPAWLGLKMQATVAELFTARNGVKLRAAKQHYRHKDYDWLVCHLDYRVQGKSDELVEVKTRAYMTGWGEEGTEKVPPKVWVQAQHEMLVVGAKVCHVAVLFGHHTYRDYTIPRNEPFLEAVVPKLERFWHENVLARVPPEPIGSDIDEAIIRARHPDVLNPVKAATPDQVPLVRQFLLARYNATQAKAAEQAMKIRVIDLIGDAEGINGAFGTITYRKSKDSIVVTWDLVAAAYRRMLEGLHELAHTDAKIDPDKVAPTEELDAIESLYTQTEEGKRRIDVRESKEEVSVAS